jgi:hypothetical protein
LILEPRRIRKCRALLFHLGGTESRGALPRLPINGRFSVAFLSLYTDDAEAVSIPAGSVVDVPSFPVNGVGVVRVLWEGRAIQTMVGTLLACSVSLEAASSPTR